MLLKDIKFDEPAAPVEVAEGIYVRQYLPVNDKLNLIAEVINNSMDNNRFYNPGKIDVYFEFALVENYTDIEFTDEDYDNILDIYDNFSRSGLMSKIVNAIPKGEFDLLFSTLWDTIESIYKYNNSVLGIMEQLGTDFNDIEDKAMELAQKIATKDNTEFVRDVLTKLN